MEVFYCKIVGGNVDIDICATRIKQAGAMEEQGEEHFSLFKCLTCTNPNKTRIEVEPAPPESKPGIPAEEEKPVDPNEPICRVCLRPKSAIRNQFIISRQMHANCYSTAKKKGTLPPDIEVVSPLHKEEVTVETIVSVPDPDMVVESLSDLKPGQCVNIRSLPVLTIEDMVTLTVDFTGNMDIYDALVLLAQQELRTPENQLLYMLRDNAKDVES